MGQTKCSGAVGVVTDFPSYLTGDLADGDDFTPLRTAQPPPDVKFDRLRDEPR